MKNSQPHFSDLKPMLAVRNDKPFSDPDWLFEIKWDGYRIIAHKNKTVILRSRNLIDYTSKFSSISKALEESGHEFIIDGEVVVLDKHGNPDFESLQNFRKIDPARLTYYVFDILYYNGEPQVNKPLVERKALLKEILPSHRQIKYTDHVERDGEALFELTGKQDLEGIVAKRKDSLYIPGARSKAWLKIPRESVEEFVLGGYQLRENEDKIKSLIFGAYDRQENLQYIGHTGGGISDRERTAFLKILSPKETEKCPFYGEMDLKVDKRTRWLKPELVISAKFHDFTSKLHIRKPAIFRGFRDDKQPREVRIDKLINKDPSDDQKHSLKSNWPYVEKEQNTDREELIIDGHSLALWNLKKVLWKEENITKGDLLLYYSEIADYILPYLVNRPESLHIKHMGALKPGVYIKDMEGKAPEWITTWTTERKIERSDKRSVVEYLLCQDKASLLYMINLGCIDCNPWLSTIEAEDCPSYAVIDIDPTGSPFAEAVETALVVKDILNEYGLPGMPKTSGKTGIHIYIPLFKKISFSDAETICKKIALQASKKEPQLITTQRIVEKRGSKVYIDWMQNKKQQTIAAPYSVRPYPGATVSAPLEWKELKSDLDPEEFNINTMKIRLQEKGDLFEEINPS